MINSLQPRQQHLVAPFTNWNAFAICHSLISYIFNASLFSLSSACLLRFGTNDAECEKRGTRTQTLAKYLEFEFEEKE